MAIAVGFLQVLLGLGVGIANGIRTKHWSHVWEKAGIAAFVLGLTLVIAALVLRAPTWLQAVGGLVLMLGLVAAFKGGSIIGVVESIGALTNIARTLVSWPSALPARSSPMRATS